MNKHSKWDNCQDIPGLINNINTNPDILHLDYSPSVFKLSECGLEVAIAILPLLDSEDIWERYRAQRVLEGVIQRRYGWKSGKGYPSESSREEQVINLLREMGNYQADASTEQRTTSISQWKNWLQKQISLDEKK